MSKKHQEEAHQKHAEQQDETTQECACEKKAELVAEPEEKKPDYYEQLVRLSADFENYRKRTDREKASFLAYGKKEFAERLLPSYEVLLRQLMEMD